jgi:hypothetical protein
MNIFWQHTNNWFTRATQTERQTIDNHQKPLVMTLSDMDWSPTTLDVVVWARSSSLQFLTVKNVYSGQCNVKTSIISGEGISYSHMKVYIALPAQMAEQGWHLAKAWWTLYWCMHHGNRLMGRPHIMVWKLQIWTCHLSDHPSAQETPTWSHFLHTIGTILSSMTTPMFNLKEPQEIFFSKTT